MSFSLSIEELVRRAEAWCAADPDPKTAEELRQLLRARDEKELKERFSSELDFGTAGLRGILGAGPNRMNRAVVRRTTAGVARYLKAEVPDLLKQGVVIGRDARQMSGELAEDTAGVFAAEGIPVLFFPSPVPTPLVAYATSHLGCACGVVVTASHNPPEYNGYKLYWSDGAQITPPHDRAIADQIRRVESANRVPLLPVSAARARKMWSEISEELGRSYLEAILAERRFAASAEELRVVYTPLHGVGAEWVRKVMARMGVEHFHVVEAQEQPDGTFPTVRFPNPEEPGAMDLARSLATQVKADLVLANDPDADRLAVITRSHSGELRALSGDEVGTLLAHYLLTQTKSPGRTPLVITTIVSSSPLKEMARRLGARYEETLTGFKWIANRALSLEKSENLRFLFGYEEALGYGVGPVVRDKDGIGAAAAVVDMALWCRSRQMGLQQYLEQIQSEFGLVESRQKSLTFPGVQGVATISEIMHQLRLSPPQTVGGQPVVTIQDYQSGKLSLPSSNVIAFELGDRSRVVVRPSGTEPKVKCYFTVSEEVRGAEDIAVARSRAKTRLDVMVDALMKLFPSSEDVKGMWGRCS